MKLKNLSFPSLLMAIVIVTELISAFTSLRFLVSPPFVTIIRYLLSPILEPLIFFILLTVLKKKDQKVFAIVSLIFCALSFRSLINVAPLLTSGAFIDTLVNGYANTVLFSMFKTMMFAILGISLISNKKMTGLYNVIFGLGSFALLYGSVIMSIANPAAILINLSDFLFILALWYIPRFFDESKIGTTAITGKKIKFIVILVVAMYALLLIAGGFANSSSSDKSDIARDPDGFLGYSDDFWDWYYENGWQA